MKNMMTKEGDINQNLSFKIYYQKTGFKDCFNGRVFLIHKDNTIVSIYFSVHTGSGYVDINGKNIIGIKFLLPLLKPTDRLLLKSRFEKIDSQSLIEKHLLKDVSIKKITKYHDNLTVTYQNGIEEKARDLFKENLPNNVNRLKTYWSKVRFK